jgi:hypothetical protein
MKRTMTIWMICFVSLIAWIGLAFAQTAKPAAMKTVKLSNGDEVSDLTGDWDVLVENYGEWVKFGSYPNAYKITLEGSSFIGTRLQDNGPGRRVGSLVFVCGLDKNGFVNVFLVTGGGPFPCKGKISEDGNKIVLDLENKAKATLTRK